MRISITLDSLTTEELRTSLSAFQRTEHLGRCVGTVPSPQVKAIGRDSWTITMPPLPVERAEVILGCFTDHNALERLYNERHPIGVNGRLA